MRILLVSTQDYIHHPVPSRHHYIFEELAKRNEVHVPHFHVSRGKERETRLIVHEATKFPFRGPILHYTLNAPFQYAIFKNIIKGERIDSCRRKLGAIMGYNVKTGINASIYPGVKISSGKWIEAETLVRRDI